MITERDRCIIKYVEMMQSITIDQCSRLFMSDSRSKYKIAQRRLDQLVRNRYLKVAKTDTNENIYYIDRKLSYHDLLINSFYIYLLNAGVANLQFGKSKQWMNGKIISDAFMRFDYGDKPDEYTFYIILEVCWTHKRIPLDQYEVLFKSGEAHKLCQDTFPLIVIMDDTKHSDQHYYHSNLFRTVQIDFDLSNFSLIFL